MLILTFEKKVFVHIYNLFKKVDVLLQRTNRNFWRKVLKVKGFGICVKHPPNLSCN